MLAHELSHVAHRDVAVMTIASFLGIVAGLMTRLALYTGLGGAAAHEQRSGGLPDRADRHAGLGPGLRGQLPADPGAVALPRAGRRPGRARCSPGGPSALASALIKITGEMARIPTRDLREAEPFNAFFFTPALAKGFRLAILFSTHPSLERRLDQLAQDLRPARQGADRHGLARRRCSAGSKPVTAQPRRAVRAAVRGGHAAGGHRASRRPASARCASRPPRAAAFATLQSERRAAARRRRRRSRSHRQLRLHLAAGAARPRRRLATWSPSCTRSTPPWRTPGSGRRCCARWSSFADADGRRLGLVYLYKRGTFYPFAPLSGADARQRAGAAGARACSADELPLEQDLGRWFPVWGAPGF